MDARIAGLGAKRTSIAGLQGEFVVGEVIHEMKNYPLTALKVSMMYPFLFDVVTALSLPVHGATIVATIGAKRRRTRPDGPMARFLTLYDPQ